MRFGLNRVADAPADGYTLLMGAENPLLYKVMGLGQKDYSDFTAINVIARGVPIIVARSDAPFNTFPEMLAYIKANPRTVKFGSTGPGGLPVGHHRDDQQQGAHADHGRPL